MTICPSWQTGIKVPLGPMVNKPLVLKYWSTDQLEETVWRWKGIYLKPASNKSQKARGHGYDVQWRGGQFAKLIPENATCAIHKISPPPKIALLTSPIPEPFSQIFTAGYQDLDPHPHHPLSPDRKNAQKTLFGCSESLSFWIFLGSIFCGMIIYIYISYITIMKI
jgi:hypothetical protein